MHDAALVRRGERRGERQHDIEHVIGRQGASGDHRAQRLAFDQFAHDGRAAVDFFEGVNRGDVRMRQRRGRARLLPQPLGPWSVGRRDRNELQRHAAVQPPVVGLEHDAHAAAPNFADEAVAAEHRPRREPRVRHRRVRRDRPGRRFEERVAGRGLVRGEQ